ncbi:RcnB family protein [Inquilinus limosus]|uniref:anti-virulence regulator CigR family protein n=1 Tax=Inquilinus limosus TaxID=171674 RepID=UPI003F18C0E5
MIAAAALGLSTAGTAAMAAPPHGQGQGQGQGQGHGKKQTVVVPGNPGGGPGQGKGHGQGSARPAALFSPRDRDVIVNYYGGWPRAQALPPGIARNLARGKPLPPGIARRTLPPDLLARLPRYDGYEYYMVGSDIVLAAIATGIIIDILTN